MVKGISKRVIVVKTPIGSIFDEAIFILREDSLSPDMDAKQILKEACAAADEYVKNNCVDSARFRFKKPPHLVISILILCILTLLALIFLL